MAIINIERVQQIKKEKDIQSFIEGQQMEKWANSIQIRISECVEKVQDVWDTYCYFDKNKLDMSIFDVEHTCISFRNWSEYAHSKLHLFYRKGKERSVMFFFKDGYIVLEERYNYSFPDRSKDIYDKPLLKATLDDFVRNLETYCAIVVKRLNNL